MLTLLNTPVITTYGKYEYLPLSLDDARSLVQEQPPQSAIGHAATAEILTELLGVHVAVNRISYAQQPNEAAIVFKLRIRPPEGVILNRQQIEEIGYEFGFLRRTE